MGPVAMLSWHKKRNNVKNQAAFLSPKNDTNNNIRMQNSVNISLLRIIFISLNLLDK